MIRRTKIHPDLRDDFRAFVDQVVKVSTILLKSGTELKDLAEASFGGAEAESVLVKLATISEEEWRADRMQRALCQKIYSLEQDLDPVTIFFYDKMLQTLSRIANEAENTSDMLRTMIVKG